MIMTFFQIVCCSNYVVTSLFAKVNDCENCLRLAMLDELKNLLIMDTFTEGNKYINLIYCGGREVPISIKLSGTNVG